MVYEGVVGVDGWYPVILITDATGAEETGKAYTDVTVLYAKAGDTSLTTYTIGADDWKEAGQGLYAVRAGASEWAEAANYTLTVTTATSTKFRIPIIARASSLTAEAVADAVCDEALSGHATTGTVGKALSGVATSTQVAALPEPMTAQQLVDALDTAPTGNTPAAKSPNARLRDARAGSAGDISDTSTVTNVVQSFKDEDGTVIFANSINTTTGNRTGS